MNRIIKFRAWIKSGFDEDVKPFMTYEIERLHFNKGEEGIDVEDCEWDIDNIILMQFTGLKDKNGEEIYEGDIIEWDTIQWKVYFAEGVGAFRLSVIGDGEEYSDMSEGEDYEVIGNIYEDPELVK